MSNVFALICILILNVVVLITKFDDLSIDVLLLLIINHRCSNNYSAKMMKCIDCVMNNHHFLLHY